MTIKKKTGPKKMTTSEFIRRAVKTHDDKFDYSRVDMENRRDGKVEIICKKHGPFWLRPAEHIRSSHPAGCPVCSNYHPRFTKEYFITQARLVHGDKYDYSEVDLANRVNGKVKVICPIHGPFWVNPSAHIRTDGKASGCPKCRKNALESLDTFVAEARRVHGNRYGYSKVDLAARKQNGGKIIVICPDHGDFWVSPNNHLSKKSGCPLCADNHHYTTEEYIAKATEVHGGRYKYPNLVYRGCDDEVEIECQVHGTFWQKAKYHILGHGCPQCDPSRKKSQEEFIANAHAIHGDTYLYDRVDYKTSKDPVWIGCREHGYFLQQPNNHLNGQGCPICNESHLEATIAKSLDDAGITYHREYRFPWLVYKREMKLDFYLPDYQTAIECHGIQHFESIDYFGGEDAYEKNIERDKLKYDQCKEHGIRVLYFSNLADKEYFKQVILDLDELMQTIKS